MSCARSSPRRANRSPARRTRGFRAAAATAAEADGWGGGGRVGAGAWRCCGSGAGVATSTEYEVRSSSDGGWARGGALVLSTGAMRRSTSPEKAHGAQGDRIRCAHSRHGVGTEASAVHKGAVARAAIRNEAGRAAPIQSERAVALGHRQRGQIDLVLRVPTIHTEQPFGKTRGRYFAGRSPSNAGVRSSDLYAECVERASATLQTLFQRGGQ